MQSREAGARTKFSSGSHLGRGDIRELAGGTRQ